MFHAYAQQLDAPSIPPVCISDEPVESIHDVLVMLVEAEVADLFVEVARGTITGTEVGGDSVTRRYRYFVVEAD